MKRWSLLSLWWHCLRNFHSMGKWEYRGTVTRFCWNCDLLEMRKVWQRDLPADGEVPFP